jgi:predicted O-methyltransferase YrrM
MKFVVNGQFAFYAEKILDSKEYYKEYLNGKIDSAQFCGAMLADTSLSDIVAGFSKYNIPRIALTPPDEKLPSETIFKYLADNNIIPMCKDIYGGFDEYRKYIRENYDHGDFVTFIYPEDERLLYAAAKTKQPKKAFIAGSYYGYFAIWAMKAIKESGGMFVLSDIDEEVCNLAEKNFNNFGFKNNVKIYCEDAAKLLADRTEPIDMLVLDATGIHDDPRPEYRGKRIYAPFLKAAKRLLKKGSVIIIHNMEPENPEMKMLVDELESLNAQGTNYDTYNGLGVYYLV